MNEQAPSPTAFHREFSDFDSFEAAASGWKLDFLQLDPGPFKAALTQVMTGQVVITRCFLGRKILQRGETPPGFRTFGFATKNQLDLKWRGHQVGPGHLMVFPPGHSLESVSLPGFDAFAISISEDRLEGLAAAAGKESINAILPRTDLLSIPDDKLSALRDLTREILAEAIDPATRPANPGLIQKLEQTFVEQLLDAMAAGSEIENRWEDSPSRSEGYRRALGIMKERADDAIPISEVREHAGVSERTLRYAFRDAYDMSPKAYLHLLRLNRFRLELLRKPDQAVGQLAQRWGFRHLGQFSKDYYRIFGELPSETRSQQESRA
ncbi:MAG: helix-turn-helix domain-containing protein [Verrucomicrobiota bacterium]